MGHSVRANGDRCDRRRFRINDFEPYRGARSGGGEWNTARAPLAILYRKPIRRRTIQIEGGAFTEDSVADRTRNINLIHRIECSYRETVTYDIVTQRSNNSDSCST